MNQSIPECVQKILNENGFTSELSLLSIDDEMLKNVEKYTNEFLKVVINDLDCCHSAAYKSQIAEKKFQFAPGHKALILQLPRQLQDNLDKTPSMSQFEAMHANVEGLFGDSPALTNILKALVRDSFNNFQKPSTRNRYSDTIKYFATYLYMMCGRKCYEVLQSNLAMPAVSTVGMYNFHPTIYYRRFN